MANPISAKPGFARAGEYQVGTLINSALANGTFEIKLGPGIWSVALFINANALTTGTISAGATNLEGEFLTEEGYAFTQNNSPSVSFSIADFVGILQLSSIGGTAVPGDTTIAVLDVVRITLATIVGGAADNRIDYLAVRRA